MKRATYTHWKLKDLMTELGINRREAIGLLALIWDCTGQFAADIGDIGRMTDKFIAGYVDWPEDDAARMVNSLVRSRWIDEHPEHRLLIHDWQEHRERWVAKRVARSAQSSGRPISTPTTDGHNGRPQRTAIPARLSSPPLPLPSPSSLPLTSHYKEPPIVPPRGTGDGSDVDGDDDGPQMIQQVPKPPPVVVETGKKRKPKPILEYTLEFEAFWAIYPRQVGKGKAMDAWNRISGVRPSFEQLKKAIRNQSASEDWTKENSRFIPHPSTWLNQRRWDDQLPDADENKYGIKTSGGTDPDILEAEKRKWYGFDYMRDGSHVPVWQAIADAHNAPIQSVIDWRYAWHVENGPYSPERPVPTVEYPSLEAK